MARFLAPFPEALQPEVLGDLLPIDLKQRRACNWSEEDSLRDYFWQFRDSRSWKKVLCEHFNLPVPGANLGGNQLKDLIGIGATSAVYQACEPEPSYREIAIKYLLQSCGKKRFEDEYNKTAAVEDEHVVRVFGLSTNPPHFAMNVARSLSDVIHSDEWFPPDSASRRDCKIWNIRVAKHALRIAEAMHGLHTHLKSPILHLDLKASNVLLGKDDKVMIADLGMSQPLVTPTVSSTNTPAAAMNGTPTHMAPEQVKNGNLSPSTDVWGIGTIIYEMLRGKSPFARQEGESDVDLFDRITTAPVAYPCEVNDRVDEKLAAICIKCLKKKPQDRYATANDLASDLKSWLNGWPVRAISNWEIRQPIRFIKKYPWQVSGLIVCCAIFVGRYWHNAQIQEVLKSSTGITGGSDGFLYQDFVYRPSNPNPVSWVWFQAFAGSRLWLVPIEDQGDPAKSRLLRVWFENRESRQGPNWPGNFCIRPMDEKSLHIDGNERYLHLNCRIPPPESTSEKQPQSDKVQLAVRLIDALGTHWEYAYKHDDYVPLVVSRGQAWTNIAINLQGKTWIVFPTDGNHEHAAQRPVFSEIKGVIIEVGAPSRAGALCRPSPGSGRIDIGKIALTEQE